MNELLTADHRELDDLLARFYRCLENGSTLEIYERLDIFWARLAMHIRAEHLHLFPAILKAVEKKIPSELEAKRISIEKMHSDHDFFVRELAAAVRLLRIQIRDGDKSEEKISVVREKVTAVEELLKTHNEFEESELYLWAENLVELLEHDALRDLIQKELDRLPPRFDGDRDRSRPRKYESV